MKRWASIRTCALAVSLVAGCTSSSPDASPQWHVVIEGAPEALLRVMGNPDSSVYAVGADTGAGPAVYRVDGVQPVRLETHARGSLWWWTRTDSKTLQMVGDQGLILQHRPSTGSFETLRPPTTERLFGAWSDGSDTWYVGGNLDAETGVILRGDGDEMTAPPGLDPSLLAGAFFKVEGFNDGSLWIVGQGGRALYFDGTTFHDENADTALPLLSVSGVDPDHVYAVGGAVDGIILRRDGSRWVEETPAGAPQLISVWATSPSEAYAVGFNGRMYVRADGVWSEFEPAPPTFEDLHAVWVDANGGIWLAGGRLATDPPTDGVLLYYGHAPGGHSP